jgi:hypothetical protein
MNDVFTARLPAPLMRRLRKRARDEGTTPSAFVRALLDRELGPTEGDPPALALTSRWVGAVHSTAVVAGRDARHALVEWQPDRRG